MTPEELNAITDEALFRRIDAIVESSSSVDCVPTSDHGLAQYITLELLWRVHERLVGRKLNGKPAKTKLLAWVIMGLTYVTPPLDVKDVETFGNRIDQFLKRQYTDKTKSTRASRKLPPAERDRQRAELDARCCWLTGRPSYIQIYSGLFPEPGSAVPTPTPATRPAGHVPFARSRLREPKETLAEARQLGFEDNSARDKRKLEVEKTRRYAETARADAAVTARDHAEALARDAEAGRQRLEQQQIKAAAASAADKIKLKQGAAVLRHTTGQVVVLQQQVVSAHADAQAEVKRVEAEVERRVQQARAIQADMCKADAKRSAEQQARREAKLRRLQDHKAQAELAAMHATAVACAALQREKRLARERVVAQERKAAAQQLGRQLLLEGRLGSALQEGATLQQQLQAAQQQLEAAEAARAAAQRLRWVAEARKESVKVTSRGRLEKRRAMEDTVADLKTEVEELRTQLSEGCELRRARDDAYEKVLSMPSWRPVRGKGAGRGAAAYDKSYRVAVYAMLANGTPLASIGRNIQAVVQATAPWLTPQEPSHRFMTEARFELRTMEECLGARKAASAYRIRMLGSDESSKFGNAGITSNLLIEPEEGEACEVVILRGVYCSAGGTAAAVAQAIETKCFARLRDFSRRWRATFERMFPGEAWTGPAASQLSLARLAGGGALQSDTCPTAQLTKTLLVAMVAKQYREQIGEQAWSALSEAEQAHATRVHKLDCWQHMRNIFLKEMSAAQAAHVADELKPHLDAFGSWERMSTDYSSLLRAAYKEFHCSNAYYKGKGREFWAWMRENHPKVFAPHFERAEGGRQDLDYDAAIPLYVMRKYMIEFLHTLVFGSDHSNVLEDFLYLSFSSMQFIAMTRANALVDLLISRPLRWLSGNSYLLDNWSPLDMSVAADLVYDILVKVEADGSCLLDPTLDIFKSIAHVQPLFAAWRKYTFEEQLCLSPDGSTKHLTYALVRAELLNPTDPSNVASRLKTIEYLEVQATGGLKKMRDPKISLAKWLTSQDGAHAIGKSQLARADTLGLDATNDRLAESCFGNWDYVLRRCPGITMEAASAIAQAIRAKSFAEGGAFHLLPPHEQDALIEFARTTVREERKVDRAHHAELDSYHAAKRISNSQLELTALVKMYALALSFFDRWKERGVASSMVAEEALDQIDSRSQLSPSQLTQLKLNFLREQIEMRVIGLGFDEFKAAWSSSKNEDIGTVQSLTEHLHDILMEEDQRRREKTLPANAVVPQMRRKTYKELGTPTLQADDLAGKVKELPAEELLERAQRERTRLEAVGELDTVGDLQPERPPPCDNSLVGTMLEIRWRYWALDTDPTTKRKKMAVDIWCEGEVVQVANGSTDTEGPRCTKLLEAGAVRIKFKADAAFEEQEQYTWSILRACNWNAEAVLGWRYTEAELCKRSAKKRPREG